MNAAKQLSLELLHEQYNSLVVSIPMMNELLNPVRITTIGNIQRADDQLVAIPAETKRQEHGKNILRTPEDALENLKSKPDLDLLTKALQWLDPARTRNDQFNIKAPGPQAAPILFVLVENIVPNYWTVLNDERSLGQNKQSKLIVRCLSSIAGIGALAARLRVLLDVKHGTPNPSQVEGKEKNPQIEDLLDVLQSVLQKDTFLLRVWRDIKSFVANISQRSLMWKELISSVAASRILSLAGEADHILNKSSPSIKDRNWLGDGSQYAAWLGRNIAHMTTTLESDDIEAQKALGRLLDKALKLGHIGEQIEWDASINNL